MTYSALRKLLGLGSTTTISDYCSYLENSYLCYFMTRYSPSLKVQQQSPKKVYFIDHALAKIIGFRFSEDRGRMLENIIFLELKRRGKTIFYHKGNKECDFVIQNGTNIQAAMQVTQGLSDSNTHEREVSGLIEALEQYSLSTGIILTELDESDEIVKVGQKNIKLKVAPYGDGY